MSGFKWGLAHVQYIPYICCVCVCVCFHVIKKCIYSFMMMFTVDLTPCVIVI